MRKILIVKTDELNDNINKFKDIIIDNTQFNYSNTERAICVSYNSKEELSEIVHTLNILAAYPLDDSANFRNVVSRILDMKLKTLLHGE